MKPNLIRVSSPIYINAIASYYYIVLVMDLLKTRLVVYLINGI